MAGINVNPTAMELKNLKKKLNVARRGHKLLKDKRDELMRQFLDMAKETMILREKIEGEIRYADSHMAIAASVMTDEQVETALIMPKQTAELDINTRNIMSVSIPVFKVEYKGGNDNDIYPYGYGFTSGELDEAVRIFGGVFKQMIRLAEVEKSCQLMADEIERTRRRVNALEHIMIPRYEEKIRYISMKLEENERSTITRLMKVKDMMIEENYA